MFIAYAPNDEMNMAIDHDILHIQGYETDRTIDLALFCTSNVLLISERENMFTLSSRKNQYE